MDAKTFDKFLDDFQADMAAVLKSKGADYSGSEDRLANFRRNAMLLGRTPEEVWAVYTLKHVDAILTWVRTRKVSSESIHGRFLDLANYCILGAALAAEQNE